MLMPDGRIAPGSARNSLCGSLYSGRTSLYASSNRSSLSGRSNSRSSSVSIRLPNYNGNTYPENLLLPSHNRTSRMSLVSAWESFRGSVLSLSKFKKEMAFFVAPCSKHRCCLGCVSLRDAIPLICVAELVVIALLTLIAVDLYVTDGKLFYTNEMEGRGQAVATLFIVFIVISVPVVGVTLTAWHFKKKQFYLIHVAWQWTVLEMLIYFAYTILSRVFSPKLREDTHFLLPSAIVLSIVSVVAVFVQCWWLFVFIDAMFYERTVSNRKDSNASSNQSKRQNNSRVGVQVGCDSNFETESMGTEDSRRHSFAIPIVKLRKASEDMPCIDRRKSLDTESLPGLRLTSVMEGIPEDV